MIFILNIIFIMYEPFLINNNFGVVSFNFMSILFINCLLYWQCLNFVSKILYILILYRIISDFFI